MDTAAPLLAIPALPFEDRHSGPCPSPAAELLDARACLIAHGEKISDEALREALTACGASLETTAIRLTSPTLGADQLAEAAARAGVERVVALGGDGTIEQVVDGLMRRAPQRGAPRPCLGVVPLGTANDLATSAGLPDDLEAALALALDGEPRTVDVGRIGNRAFLNVVTGGVMSEATANLDPGIKAKLGDLAYTLAGLLQLPSIEPIPICVTTRGWSWSGQILALAVGNARAAGGGFELCPDARMDDGLLDLTLVPADVDTRALLELLLSRSVAACEQVLRIQVDRLHLAAERPIHLNADGEPLEVSEIEIGVEPGALRMSLPPGCDLLGER